MQYRSCALTNSATIAVVACLFLIGEVCEAQPQVISRSRATFSAQPVQATPAKPSPPSSKPSSGSSSSSKSSSKDAEKKKEGEKSKDDKKSGEDAKADVVTRPSEPDSPPDPSELEARPNEAGRLVLNFQGQPWPDVIRWLKVVSNKSLDWQELPSGFLNLSTHREYTVEEARSLINRHLLARGYTILVRGEMMTVEKIDKLNPAMVPRLNPADLDGRDDYEFVKVSFALTALVADKAAEELKPMLSPNGKLVPLSTTNRLEGIDAVINLREIRDILQEEQSGEGAERRVWQFELQYVRAEDIVEQLNSLLGIQRAAAGPMSSSQMQQLQKMIQQAAQKGGGGAKQEQETRIVAVPRENVILVMGSADKIAVVAEAVELLDQPTMRSQSMLDSISRTEVYRLANLDPEKFIETLEELGGLSPLTQIKADTSRGTVIVSGSRSDHLIVEVLVEKLDGTSRMFHVIPLRKLDAEYVAGSIKLMMGVEDGGNKQDDRRSYYYYSYSSRYSSSSSQKKDDGDKFQVDADVEYNRLLLRANDSELEQVRDLLIKLGELPMPGGNPNRRRVFETGDVQDAMELIERLQKVWPSRGANELKVTPPVIEPKKEAPLPSAPLSPDQLEPLKKVPEQPDQKAVKGSNGKTASRAASVFDPGRSERTQVEPAGNLIPPVRWLTASLAVEVAGDDSSTSDEGTSSEPVDGATEAVESAVTPQEIPPASKERDVDAVRELLRQMREKRNTFATPESASGNGAAPIHVRVGPNGELYFESDDPAALDLLEDVLDEYAPPKRDWKVFKLTYPNTWAYGIEIILKDIFKEEMEADEKGGGMRYSPFFGYYPSSGGGNSPRRLSARKPLKIISDRDTHTILVQGASVEQLRMIEELIEIYDQPQSTEAASIRKTQLFQIKYSKAKVIADALKDVYRDLLSENDKALQQGRGNDKEKRPVERSYTYIYGGGGEGEEKESPIRFKGLLSIGIDESSNILIVSASEGLLNNIAQIVEQLDLAARPNSSFKVMQVNTRVNLKELQEKLHKMLAPKPPQNKDQQNQKNQQQNQNNNNGNQRPQ